MGTSISAILTAATSAGGVPPSAPTALVLSNIAATQLQLDWTVPTAGLPATYQPQYRPTGTTAWTNYPSSGAILGTSIVITGLTANTQYDFQVIAANGYGSKSSAQINGITAGVAPGAPTGLIATATATMAVHTAWTASPSGAPAPTYSVAYRTPTGSGNYTPFGTTTAGTSLDITGLTINTQYEFRVTATNSAGTAIDTTTATATTLSGQIAPGAPTALIASAATGTSITLAWTKSAVGTGNFSNKVEYCLTGSGAWATAGTTTDPTDSLTINNLMSGTTYDFRVTSSNAAGAGPASAIFSASTISSGNVRNVTLNPGAGGSMWVLPFGSNAVWSGDTDVDTASLIGKVGTVNADQNGIPIYVAAPGDPLVTFTSSGATGTQRDANLTVTLHCPKSATPAKPFPGGDCQMVIFDPTTDPTKMWCWSGCSFVNGTDVTGGVTATNGEVDLVCGSMEDALTGNFGFNAGMGVIRAADLDSTQSPNGIQHGLRFACDISQLIPPTTWDLPTNPTTRKLPSGQTLQAGAVQIYWPQTHTDYNAPTAWTGNMPAGATVGVPSSVAMPSGLTAGGKLLWQNAKNFGWHWRHTAPGGVTLYAEPGLENNSLIAGMRGDMAKIVPYLRVLRNQGATSVQGGGTLVAAAPPPIDPAVCGAPIAPTQVTGVTLNSDTATSANLTWTQPTGSLPMSYVIQASVHAANAWTLSSSTISGGTTGTMTGLTAGGNYDFRVVASNSGGPGPASATLTIQLPNTTTTGTTFDTTKSSSTFGFSADKTIATSGAPAAGQTQTAVSNTTHSAGKVFVEFLVTAITTNLAVGLCNASVSTGKGSFGADSNAIAYYPVSPLMAVYFNNAQAAGTTGKTALTNGHVISIAVDIDAKLFWVTDPAMRAAFGATAWNCNASANPATGVGGVSFAGMTGPLFAAYNDDDANGIVQINGGQSAFSITVPTGFPAWGAAASSVTPPSSATGLNATGETSNSVTLAWSASATTGGGAVSYLLESSPTSTNNWSSQGSTGNTNATATNLTAGTAYDFRVTASNGGGSATPTPILTVSTTASVASSRSPAGLMSYLAGIKGKRVVSGQFIEQGPLTPISDIQSTTGKWLGLIGGDYWHFGAGGGPSYTSFNAIAKAYWAAGGLVTLTISLPNPSTGTGSNDPNNLTAGDLLTNGTPTNTAFVNNLNGVAAGLADLQAAGVTVIFRPFHESNGNWFWWGTTCLSNAQFIAAWQYVYTYFTNTKGLKNLIWMLAENWGATPTGPFPMNNRYPGTNYVDMIGSDLYTSDPASAASEISWIDTTYNKLVALAEFGPGSASIGDTNFSEVTLINAIKNSMPQVVLFQQWWDGNGGNVGWGMAETQNLSSALSNAYVINRSDLVTAFTTTATKPLITAPLPGTVTKGTWQLASYNGLYYWALAPANYDSSKSYPLVLSLHQNDMGNPFYTNGSSGSGDALIAQIDVWFNNVAFRTAHPCFVLAPLLDERNDSSGNTINWGGVDSNQQASQTNYIGLVNYWMTAWPIHPSHVLGTGNSMGGIGMWDACIKYNAYTGTVQKLFAGFLILAGSTYAYNYPNPSATILANLASVPVWSIHGASDTTVPLDWEVNVYTGLGGKTPYNGAVAPRGLMRYTQDAALGHDVWDTYYVETVSETYWAWLFAQASSNTTTTTTGNSVWGAVTRNYWDQPGGNNCVWNTPLGSGCVWGSATDADTRDLCNGGNVNIPSNYGGTLWVSQSPSNPTATFSATMQNYSEDNAYNGSGTPYNITAHCVIGSYSANGQGGTDEPYGIIDTVSHPGMIYQFAPLYITSFQAGQGPFTNLTCSVEDATSDNFAEDQETGHCGDLLAAGSITAYDLDPARNPARMPGSTTVTAIQHMLRFTLNGTRMKSNVKPAGTYPSGRSYSDGNNGILNANAWPQHYEDFQGSLAINNYTGNYLYGTTCGIPMSTAMPSGLTNAGQQWFWAMQHYGGILRDQGGNNNYFVDQYVSISWVSDLDSDFSKFNLVQYLRPLRNQHLGGQSFATSPRNGPGSRVDIGPPPLAGTSGTGLVNSVNPPSTNGTVINITGTILYDATGEAWSLVGTGAGAFSAAINGTVDSTYTNLNQLLFYSSLVYAQLSAGTWFYRASASDTWHGPVADPRSTTTNPASASGTVVNITGVYLYDATGEAWSLTGPSSGSFSVVVNGTTDTTRSNITQLLYLNSRIYEQTSAGLWYSKAQASDAWQGEPKDPRT